MHTHIEFQRRSQVELPTTLTWVEPPPPIISIFTYNFTTIIITNIKLKFVNLNFTTWHQLMLQTCSSVQALVDCLVCLLCLNDDHTNPTEKVYRESSNIKTYHSFMGYHIYKKIKIKKNSNMFMLWRFCWTEQYSISRRVHSTWS